MSLYNADKKRYGKIDYQRCGRSGLKLPLLSLGLWHNFGDVDIFDNGREILRYAFDNGITHFDLANNYGPSPGSAEENFGKIFKKDFKPYRDEMIISTKAGYGMWDGPYGDWGSKKYLVSSLDQSLKRMGLDYVDIFYHHRPDPDTPLEETMAALDLIVRQGKALYVGISNYNADETKEAVKILNDMGTPCLINQIRYSMFERWSEKQLLDTAQELGVGIIAFSPLAQGLLTDRYLDGIPENSRAAKSWGFLQKEQVNSAIDKIRALNEIAVARGQSLAQMSIAWLLKDKKVTSVLVGASSTNQLEDNLASLDYLTFSSEEINEINDILS
ncbi:MAG: L-glyceraldehyde 3-phosphate reductase [Prolixibacteraceae bacterium]|jgi:L-glyceraldehyde 3-phosphate reductase|nr:L-glyceraldehyde 3-phosphate reductase [Prolixibacteraceae bacterium]